MQNFLSELQRRKVLRVASGYVVAGWVILQVALSLQAAMKLPDWFATIIVSLLIIGFPIALIVSWFFEFTPDGIKRTVPSNEVGRFKPQTADFALAAALALVLAAVGVQLTTPQTPAVTTAAAPKPEPEIPAASIAVLPFADLSPAQDQVYFSDGLAEEILNVLARVDGLKVASRTSSFQFRNPKMGARRIAGELGVRHVLEGSVRKAGSTIRVTAQLIDGSSDAHLWSETFDRPLTAENVFSIQDEIAGAVSAALRRKIGASGGTTPPVADKRRASDTADLNAYDLYLQARALYQARSHLDRANELLARAVERDPNFSDAWALRAASMSLLKEYTDSELSYAEVGKLVDEYADRALSMNPKSARAIAARANFRVVATWNRAARYDLGDIVAELRKAIALDPRDSSAMNWLGSAYALVGDKNQALKAYEACAAFDPWFGPCSENVYDELVAVGRYDEAWERFQSVVSKGIMVDGWVNFALLAHFDQKAAFMLASNHSAWLPKWRRHGEIYEAFRNLKQDHRKLASDMRDFIHENRLTNSGLSRLLLPLGAFDAPPDIYSMWGPDHAAYRSSPQFKAYIRSTGVYDYWRKHGFPPQCKAVGADDFECD